MTTDIAKLYLKVKQRSEKDRGKSCEHQAEEARVAAHLLMSSQTLAKVQAFARLEKKWLSHRVLYLDPVAPKFESAIRSGDFVCNYRTINNYNTGFNPEEGWLYLMTTTDRPGEVKIGCTINELRRRLLRIRRQHEPNAMLFSAKWVRKPALLENILHTHYSLSRVAGNTSGASTEWFEFDEYKVERYINNIVTRESEFWHEELRFCLDCEAKVLIR
jgi:hypothetical protein